MSGLRRILVLWLLSGCLASGCTSTQTSTLPTTSTPANPESVPPAPADPTASAATSARSSAAAASPEEMQQVMAEIQAVGELDPDAREQLLENLHQTTPDLWPLVAQQFRAALAYRRRAEEKERMKAETRVAQVATECSRDQHAGVLPARVDASRPPAGHVEPQRPPTEAPQRPGPVGSDYPSTGFPSPEERLHRSTPGDPIAPANGRDGGPTSSPTGPVTAAGYALPSEGDWQASLEEAIGRLQSRLDATPQSDTDLAAHARLRMLQLLARRRDDALSPIPFMSPSLQDFWSKELYGLATLLDTQTISDSTIRTVEAQRHLAEAIARLKESSPLVVRNLAFVIKVENYGTFTPFEKYEFEPEERVILYAELENFKSRETAQGYHTALKSSYEIFDSRGTRVAYHEFSTNEEECRNPRRDFFIGYEFCMPKRIYPGRHVLKLTVTDLNSQKIGQSSIDFTITGSEG